MSSYKTQPSGYNCYHSTLSCTSKCSNTDVLLEELYRQHLHVNVSLCAFRMLMLVHSTTVPEISLAGSLAWLHGYFLLPWPVELPK